MRLLRSPLISLIVSAVGLFLLGLVTTGAHAQDKRGECIRQAHSPAVVRITYSFKTASDGDDETQGSGFLVREDGYLLTAAHVVSPPKIYTSKVTNEEVKVTVGSMFGQEFVGSIITRNTDLDVALVKIPAMATNWPTVQVDFLPSPEKRRWLYSLGFPSGGDLTGAGPGTVTSVNAIVDGKPTQWLNTSVPLNPGMSGGPIFNEFGEVSGLAAAIKGNAGGSISYVVPINLASNLIANAGLADYKRSPCADDYRDIAVKFVQDAANGKPDKALIADQLWDIIQAQTNGTGKYQVLNDLGAMSGLDVLNQNHFPQGSTFTIKTTHANGSMVWGVAYNRLQGKIDWANSNPQVEKPAPNPTPVIVGTYSVCVGEKAEQCFGHEHAACGTDIKGWSKVMCRNKHQTQLFELTQLSDRPGNQCGYAIFDVACLKP